MPFIPPCKSDLFCFRAHLICCLQISALSCARLCRDVLCTDKTGTLTVDTVRLVAHLDALLRPSQDVFRLAFANSFFQVRRSLSLALCMRASPHEPRPSCMQPNRTRGTGSWLPVMPRFSAMLVAALAVCTCEEVCKLAIRTKAFPPARSGMPSK